MTLESAIYIAYREVEKDSDNWRPEIDCEPVDVALIAAVAGGSALGKYHYNCSDFYASRTCGFILATCALLVTTR